MGFLPSREKTERPEALSLGERFETQRYVSLSYTILNEKFYRKGEQGCCAPVQFRSILLQLGKIR